MTLTTALDAQLARVRRAGLTPSCWVLSFADRRRLTAELHGTPAYHAPNAHPYALFVGAYRGLPIVQPGLAYDGGPAVGVRQEEDRA